MMMKTVLFLFLSSFPILLNAQCALEITDDEITSFLGNIVDEFTASSYSREDLTYLCYSRSDSDNSTFDSVRVSLLFRFGGTRYSVLVTFFCRVTTWTYDSSSNSMLSTPENHITTNMTIEGCSSCSDSTTEDFGSPTWCTTTNPCDSAQCLNGGTCNRTDLTTSNCICAGSWEGTDCSTCSSVSGCPTDQVDLSTCSCRTTNPPPTPKPGLSPGAIVGLVIACLVLIALIIAIIIIIIVIIATYRSKRKRYV